MTEYLKLPFNAKRGFVMSEYRIFEYLHTRRCICYYSKCSYSIIFRIIYYPYVLENLYFLRHNF